jgi:hypothetical protein
MKKELVIFDLNGVLIYRKYARGEFVSNFPDGAFVLDNHLIWIRPGLDELFDYAFEHFEVAVWSSMQEINVNKILPYLFKERKLYFAWSQKHCWYIPKTDTRTKVLENVWDVHLNFNNDNTLIIDDSKDKCRECHFHIETWEPGKPSNVNLIIEELENFRKKIN